MFLSGHFKSRVEDSYSWHGTPRWKKFYFGNIKILWRAQHQWPAMMSHTCWTHSSLQLKPMRTFVPDLRGSWGCKRWLHGPLLCTWQWILPFFHHHNVDDCLSVHKASIHSFRELYSKPYLGDCSILFVAFLALCLTLSFTPLRQSENIFSIPILIDNWIQIFKDGPSTVV